MIKVTALCVSAALLFTQSAAASTDDSFQWEQPETHQTDIDEGISCSGEGYYYYFCVAGLLIYQGGKWVIQEGYPDFEREIFRPTRDKVVEIIKKAPREIERIGNQVADEAERAAENIAKTPREAERIAHQIGDEAERTVDNIAKAPREVKRIGGQVEAEAKRFIGRFKF